MNIMENKRMTAADYPLTSKRKGDIKTMINEPSVDVMIRKLGTEEEPISRYALCTIAAKRARQIIETEKNLGIHDSTGKDKELLSACKDIADGKVVVAKD